MFKIPVLDFDDDLFRLESKAQIPQGPLLPLLPPRLSNRPLPRLAPRPENPPPLGPHHPQWTCETYYFPAAFPRTSGTSRHPAPTLLSQSTSKLSKQRVDVTAALGELYKKAVIGLEHTVDIQDPSSYADQEPLLLVANRYVRRHRADQKGQGLTLVLEHANGFHKEIFEPMLSAILDSPDTPPITEIWSLDCVNQGDSAILNAAVLGDTFHWSDHARDLLQFLIYFIDSPSLSTPPSSSYPHILTPKKLEDPSISLLDARPPSSATPTTNHTIVGIGHSLGGAATVLAASALPSLFSCLIAIDPVLPPPSKQRSTRPMAGSALTRKSVWGSKSIASESFLSKEFFRQWDRRVLDKHIEFGLIELAGDEGVALKANPKQEAAVFSDPCAVGARRVSSRLHLLPPTLPLHFLWAHEGQSVLGEEVIEEVMKNAQYATAERVSDSSHLIVQLDPDSAGQRIGVFLNKTYPEMRHRTEKL